MLFIIGLELDPQRLWKLRAAVFGGGALQMVICGGLLGLFCMLLGLRWQVAELIGMTLALSSTAIAMQAMNERNLMVTQMGRSAFAVLLFQDIAAIPLVAMIPLLATSSASTTMGAFALSALKVAGALVLVVLLGRYVTRPALRFVARSGLREVFSAVALFLVFGFGLLLEEVGLSMAMGAFLAGVLLASSEYRHALESDIEPFKGLLLGLFFIGVGMSIDFGTLLENPLRIVILLLGFLIIKIAMLWLIARPLQVPNKQRRWFAVLLGQGSEFAFVVFGAAQMANVLEPEWAKSLTLAVALSMAATPINFQLHGGRFIAHHDRFWMQLQTADGPHVVYATFNGGLQCQCFLATQHQNHHFFGIQQCTNTDSQGIFWHLIDIVIKETRVCDASVMS